MARIRVELHYYPREEGFYAWERRKLGERVEIKEEEIAEIAKRLGVAINIKERQKLVFFLPRLFCHPLNEIAFCLPIAQCSGMLLWFLAFSLK